MGVSRVGLLRVVKMLALVVWVGGIVFFAFVVAPVAFGRLPSAHQAGIVVGASLRVLHGMGLVAGAVFLLASLGRQGAARWPFAGVALVTAMMVTTAVSQWGVLPRMERDRVAAGGAIEEADVASGPRVDFERLHKVSERMEGGVLLLGLGAVVLLGLEREPHAAR